MSILHAPLPVFGWWREGRRRPTHSRRSDAKAQLTIAPVTSTVVEQAAASQPVVTAAVSWAASPSNAAVPAAPNSAETFAVHRTARVARQRCAELESVIDRLELRSVVEREQELARVSTSVAVARAELSDVTQELRLTRRALSEERVALVNVHREQAAQQVGLYEFEHPAEVDEARAATLASVREQIRELVHSGGAAAAIFDESVRYFREDGGKFVLDLLTVLLMAYNAEAENAIRSVPAIGVGAARDRLEKAAASISQHGSMIEFRIKPEYHRLRMREIELAA